MATRRCPLCLCVPRFAFRITTILGLTMLLALGGAAQRTPQAATRSDSQQPVQEAPATGGQNDQGKTDLAKNGQGKNDPSIAIPAQTRLALVLTHPVDSKSVHRGDLIYAQTTAPVAVGDHVVIPAGTFVQGRVEKLTRYGTRGEFVMQSASVMFANGYVANIGGPMTVESDEGTAWRNPSSGAKVGAIIAPLAGAGAGAAIGSAAHTTQSSTLGGTTITQSSPKGVAIGSVAGLGAGLVIAVALIARSHSFYVEVGSPMEMTLPQPLTLAANQVADAIQAQSQAPPITPVAPRPSPPPIAGPVNYGTCYTPGMPGTPPTTIPGTPAIGNSPGTPTIVIPGTPPTPGVAYPCP